MLKIMIIVRVGIMIGGCKGRGRCMLGLINSIIYKCFISD